MKPETSQYLPNCQWSGVLTDPRVVKIKQLVPSLLADLGEILGGWGTNPPAISIHVADDRAEFRQYSKYLGKYSWAIAHAVPTRKGQPGSIILLNPGQWETHNPAHLAGYLVHEMTHVWQNQRLGQIRPIWWTEGLAHWTALQLRPEDVEGIQHANMQNFKNLITQQEIRHVDQLRFGVKDIIKHIFRREPRYPYTWNYEVGMALFEALGNERVQQIISLWLAGQSVTEAISTCLGQPWRELGRIPGPLFQ